MKFSEIKKRAEDEWSQLQHSKAPTLFIGAATCGRSAGALETKKAFQDEFEKRGISANIIEVGCLGPCWAEPLISIKKPDGPNIFYKNVTPKRAIELVGKFIVADDPLPEYALGLVGDKGDYDIPVLWDLPNFKSQKRILGLKGKIAWEGNLDEWRSGYKP